MARRRGNPWLVKDWSEAQVADAPRDLTGETPTTLASRIMAVGMSLGDDARRAHNTKAGAPDNQFGVKLGDIRAMAKKIKTDHELALNLWDTGNVEAQLLATLIIKPKSLSADELDMLTRSTTWRRRQTG